MITLSSILILLLGHLFASASPVSPLPPRMILDDFEEQGVWGPTAVWYWRCRPPFLIEASDDLETWLPSSVCLDGTCCSMWADGPVCTREACELVGSEPGNSKVMGIGSVGDEDGVLSERSGEDMMKL
ncbi:hypothetical protein VMCG_03815 [Cytospora schulzeri]|uniref:Uncharacterized protein n=1 Tax=Cytospora schulzeri TaxID=448051 RepID=A0A423WVI1_9PEZI|nr:hypothetical protein VMCG_03815 [Valsa malicola]